MKVGLLELQRRRERRGKIGGKQETFSVLLCVLCASGVIFVLPLQFMPSANDARLLNMRYTASECPVCQTMPKGEGMHMESQGKPSHTADSATNDANALGFYVSLLTVVLTVVTFAIGLSTPPLSGPSCADSCFEYPYLDIASRFPRDYLWMYPAMVLTLIYVVLMACIHSYASADKKIWGQIGLSIALLAVAMLIADYFIQVSVIQPSLERGETDGLALLTQYNPHGIFIALEDAGYWLMSISFLCAAPVFSRSDRVERAVRWIFITSFLLVTIAFVVISVVYGVDREYRFEVVAISIDWLALIVSGVLLSIVFRRAMRTAS